MEFLRVWSGQTQTYCSQTSVPRCPGTLATVLSRITSTREGGLPDLVLLIRRLRIFLKISTNRFFPNCCPHLEGSQLLVPPPRPMPSDEEAGRSCPEAQTPQQLALISMNLVVVDPLVTDTLGSARDHCRPLPGFQAHRPASHPGSQLMCLTIILHVLAQSWDLVPPTLPSPLSVTPVDHTHPGTPHSPSSLLAQTQPLPADRCLLCFPQESGPRP